MAVHGSINENSTVRGSLNAGGHVGGKTSVPTVVYPDPYYGPYEVTPTQGTQVLETDNLFMRDNVTINPIPSNYGLITWDGSTLTVS